MHTLAQLCVRRPVFATMLILSLVVVGIFSYFSLGVDLFPKVDIPTVVVIIANPGASPEEIETEISKRVEDAVNTISEVDEVRSTSSEGQSLVTIQFELSKNGDVAAQEVQNKVNLIVPQLPQTAKQPIVQKFDPDAAPILQIAVSAKRSLRDVTLIADKQIKQKLENARGVGQITIVGGARREIHVDVDPDRLRSYSLTINDVFNALRAQNLELPGGNLNAGARELTVRTTGRIVDSAQFNQITVATRNGYVVKVSDIGKAEDSYQEPRSAARLDGVPGRDPDRGEAERHEHGHHRRRSQAAAEGDFRRAAAGCQSAGDQRSIGVYQGRGGQHQAPPDRRQHLRVHHHLPVPGQHPHHADRRRRHSHLDHLDLRPDGRHGVHPQPDHHAGADPDGGHRDRRRHHRAGKCLPVHRGKEYAAVRGGDQGHQGNRPRRDGHHA